MKSPSNQPLVFLVTAAILLGAGACLARPRLAQWHELREKEKSLRAALGQHKAVVARLTQWLKAQNVPDALLPLFPADKKMDVYWLSLVDNLAARHGLTITQRRVGEEQAVGDAFELPLEVRDCAGREEAFVRFLFDLQTEAPLVDVRQLFLRRDDKGGMRGRFLLCCLFTRDTPGRSARLAANAGQERAKPAPTEEAPRFERYQVVVDRKTFGSPPPEPAPPPARFFAADLRLVAVVEDGSETRVAFVDITTKKTYHMTVGETQDGIQVIDADLERGGVALLRKGVEEGRLRMDGFFAPPQSAPAGAGAPAGLRESYAERMKKRREAVRDRQVSPPALTDDGIKERLEQYQMELLRAGGKAGPPLPIPLTKEMDDRLVAEGVLPPQE